MNDLQEQLNAAETKNHFNNWVAVTVALVSVFMAVTKVKDDNISDYRGCCFFQQFG